MAGLPITYFAIHELVADDLLELLIFHFQLSDAKGWLSEYRLGLLLVLVFLWKQDFLSLYFN